MRCPGWTGPSSACSSRTSSGKRSARAGVAPQCAPGQSVGAGRASQPEVDAAGKQRFQRAELLGDHQRRVIRQHDAARADADPPGCGRHLADHHRGGGARDARHVVVLRQPVALEAERVGVARERQRAAQRLAHVAAGRHMGKIEDRQLHRRPRRSRSPNPASGKSQRRPSAIALKVSPISSGISS